MCFSGGAPGSLGANWVPGPGPWAPDNNMRARSICMVAFQMKKPEHSGDLIVRVRVSTCVRACACVLVCTRVLTRETTMWRNHKRSGPIWPENCSGPPYNFRTKCKKSGKMQFGDSAVRWFGGSAVRRFGGSAVRWFGGSDSPAGQPVSQPDSQPAKNT